MTSVIIDGLIETFEAKLAKRSGKKTTATFLETCREVLTQHFAKAGKATKGKAAKGKPDDEKKYDTWPRIWTSKPYGGKGYFDTDYDDIKENAGEKLTSFSILSKLRDRLEAEEDKKRWNEWVAWVQKENSNAPSDPPSDRQPKKETKKKPTPKKATKVEKPDEEIEDEDEPVESSKPAAKPKPAAKSKATTKKVTVEEPAEESAPAKTGTSRSAAKPKPKQAWTESAEEAGDDADY